MKNNSIITVSQLNYYVKSLMEGDTVLSQVFLSGEISNLTDHYRSGHIYLSLKDEKSIIKCVMFSSNASRLKFALQDGMKVIVKGRVSIYETTGQYQFYIEQLQPDGIGAFTVAFEHLKTKLSAEGLFDKKNKKTLPKLPKTVGVITSPTGAVRSDIEKVLKRRYPLAKIFLYPATVQGENAPTELINAINYFNNNPVDVLIIGRGGGSIEDLWAFNDEELARTIYKCNVPVVSAVGHETDFTICDFVSDMRAPTPSAAAELISPDINDLKDNIENINYTLKFLISKKVKDAKDKLVFLQKSKVFVSPQTLIEQERLSVDILSNKLITTYRQMLFSENKRLEKLISNLQVLSPLNSLSRGYAIPLKDSKPITTIKKLKIDDTIQLKLSDGTISCVVSEIKE